MQGWLTHAAPRLLIPLPLANALSDHLPDSRAMLTELDHLDISRMGGLGITREQVDGPASHAAPDPPNTLGLISTENGSLNSTNRFVPRTAFLPSLYGT
jgi:hypothetical protein